jgi:aldose sugar dehydrogenase
MNLSKPLCFLAGLAGLLGVLGGVGCGGGATATAGSSSPPSFTNTAEFVPTTAALTTSDVATGLASPWSLAFLPDARMLVTGRTGNLWLIAADGSSRASISGLPAIETAGQGGLLDVVLDPAFDRNQRIYFSFSEADPGNSALNGTAVARAELDTAGLALRNLQVIYRQLPKVQSNGHYGSRLVFDRDGELFVTLGERQNGDQRGYAQDLSRGHGKVVHITTAGTAGTGNPFIGRVNAQPEIWSYGHRNPQGAALHPGTGELWTHEHGPQGGDEVNLTLAGRNYGWPVISFGQEYGTTSQVGEGTAKAGMEQPLMVWEKSDGSVWTGGAKSSIAPSGMAFFTGAQPAHWKGSLFLGALAGKALWRVQLDGSQVVGRERLLTALNERIRDVRQGPDGRLYLLTDSGRLMRVGGGGG